MSLDTVVWFATDFGEAVIVGLLLYRGAWRNFPVFLVYLVQAVVGDVGGAILAGNHAVYRTWYLAQAITDSILVLGVLVELAWSILRPVRASLSRRALIPVIGIIVAVGAAVWPFAALSATASLSRQTQLILHLQQTVSILQVIFLLVLIGGSQLLSIGWRDRELQVATGLGVFSAVDLAAAMLRTHETTAAQYRHLNQFVIAGYICTLAYWLISFAQKEAERRQFTPEMQRFLLAVAGSAHSARVGLTESHAGLEPNSERKSRKP